MILPLFMPCPALFCLPPGGGGRATEIAAAVKGGASLASQGIVDVTREIGRDGSVADAPSNKIVSGRYILQPEVMRVLENQGKGAGGEIQLTDAMAKMIGTQPFHAVTFDGARYDCGSKVGFVEATLAIALARPDMGAQVRAIALDLLK